MENYMQLKIPSMSENESFARTVVAAFIARLNPTIEELNDVKTAVSEAVTNCIVHAYADMQGEIEISGRIDEGVVTLKISDTGAGIEDIEQARQPFYTTATTEERSGMGFTVMETFMDSVEVLSKKGSGTQVIMKKGLK